MGQEFKAAGRSGLPKSARGGRQMKKTFNNLKITVLCGFVTILVLRGTIGVGNLGGASPSADDQKVVEDIERILREIRSDSEPDDPADTAAANSTFASYTLGPKISDWDRQRRRWLGQNPGFPNRIRGGKPRILLVTGSPPNPCDNPMGDHYLLKSTKNKIDYCQIHSIEIVYNMAHLDKELAGYWAKLPLIRRLMLSHPEVEWIWWLDSDAFFTDMAFEIPLSKYDNHSLVIHGYEEMMEKYHQGSGDEQWLFVTHFVGCKPCGSYGDYPVERCLSSTERAFNFADNQVLRLYGFAHRGLATAKIRRIRNETARPLVEVMEKLDGG